MFMKSTTLNKKTLTSFIFALLLLLVVTACDDDDSTVENTTEPTAKIAVVSDPHYFSPDLCDTASPDFKAYLAQDRKLIAESDAIFDAIVNNIINENVDIVLIPGDLTKDGAKVCHEDFATYLAKLEAAGAKVFVVPGNHDVNNAHATSYASGSVSPIASVTPDEFSLIYNNYGYSEAIYTDVNSLSYVAEPVEGLWIIGMDACKYEGHSETGGEFTPETLQWIYSKIEEGTSKGKVLIGMMHHGLVEHYGMQKTLFDEYVVNNWESVSDDFASKGLNIVFTGHYHANDVAKRITSESYILDVETGSAVTYPCPYRIMELDEEKNLTIETKHVAQINYDTKGESFQDYAYSFIQNGLGIIVKYMLMYDYGLSENEAESLSPLMTAAMIAHYAGDEDQYRTAEVQLQIDQVKQLNIMMGTALDNLMHDPAPADNNVVINLNTGEAN